MNRPLICAVSAVPLLVLAAVAIRAADTSSAATPHGQAGPSPDERQLPFAMHSQMDEMPSISVGRADGDLVGADNRALQAAVDYIAALGGGTVTIGPGEYIMYDSLHLRSHVTVRGTQGQTVLKKAAGEVSPLALDGDFGEQQITVAEPDGFAVGRGVAIWDKNSGGFHTTVARITGRRGNTFAIDKPLMADCMVAGGAQAATVFPVVSGYDIRGARVEDLIIDGNREENVHLNGCRGAGIFLYRGFGTVIRGCTVKSYNGDGISFQQSNDVVVEDCTSEGNASLGIHPGSGSQRPVVRNCIARNNGEDGLFLCWRVRHGLFEGNLLEANGRFGISIGHKDTDNLLQRNRVIGNAESGIFFRNESAGMAAHRNHIKENVIENNGGPGIRVRGATDGLVFENNSIRTASNGNGEEPPPVGILIEEQVGEVKLLGNTIEAAQKVEDRREANR
jgi:hypothetical protein